MCRPPPASAAPRPPRRSVSPTPPPTTSEILADPETDTVFIVTRHHLHSLLVCEALEAGKHVFVEKPLAITHEAQLDRVVACAEAHPDSC